MDLKRYSGRTLKRRSVLPFYQRHYPKWMVAFAILRAGKTDGCHWAEAAYCLALPSHTGATRSATACIAL